MNYEATISSKGQITIPAEVRRKLQFGQRIKLSVAGERLVIERKPTVDDMWSVLDVGSSRGGLSPAEEVRAKELIAKDSQKRGY